MRFTLGITTKYIDRHLTASILYLLIGGTAEASTLILTLSKFHPSD
jgi:hypothetical protein